MVLGAGPWQGVGVSETSSIRATEAARTMPPDLPEELKAWVFLPDVAERLDVPITKVHQMIREGALLAVRRDGVLCVPEELVASHSVIKHLPGVLTLLRDAGYNEREALRWLYSPDSSLPGTPAAALSGSGATEVKRRAQALGF